MLRLIEPQRRAGPVLRQFGVQPFDRDLPLAEVDGARLAIDRKQVTSLSIVAARDAARLAALQRLENDLPIEPGCSAPAI